MPRRLMLDEGSSSCLRGAWAMRSTATVRIGLNSWGRFDEPVSPSVLPLGLSYTGPESGIADRLRRKWL